MPGDLPIPTRLSDLVGFQMDCSCGCRHAVSLQAVALGRGALSELPDMVDRVGRSARVVLVADARTFEIAGARCERLLSDRRVERCLLPDGAGGRPHADTSSLAVVERALTAADLAVAVGAGTVNDLTKLASHRRGIPYLVVPTAPSMNGYTSAIAAVLERGLKRTIPCAQPIAVVADLEVLGTAPAEMVAAGLGDLESKPTATADYRLAGCLRAEPYCPAPEGVVREAEARVAAAAPALRARDPEALQVLTEALLLSGISMALAGSSSPASGGEHLISHYWDMLAPSEGRVEGLHGAQVGVATCVTAALYELLAGLGPIDIEAAVLCRPPIDQVRRSIRKRFGSLADEVEREWLKKRLDDAALRRELEAVQAGWAELWASLSDTLRSAAQIRGILRAAGAPTSAAELGLSAEHLQRGLREAGAIRARFTVLDFACDLGVLDRLTDEVVRLSGCADPPASEKHGVTR